MKILKIILIALLCGALAKMPYGYYQFLRIAALIGFGILAYDAFEKGNKVEATIYLGLAILFQPLFKIILPKDTWQIIDLVVALFLILSFAEKRFRALLKSITGEK